MTAESSSASSLFLEDFGQKVDLTRRIREVLLNYPEGTTVLKELIQNADDAGATVVKLCLDRRDHATQSLLSPTLAQWQGPGLLAYNDAVFSEEDFVSISRIGGSSKHRQKSKTGRFGVGFNSVYHITDLPSFVSGKHVVFFDPQGVYLPNVSVANPGKRIEYVSTSAISLYKDQFCPYCAFGCDMASPFAGTLFRFPLRNVDQAATSKLARQAYSEDDISSMFSQLYEEGVFTLLFLKSVVAVEMYIWNVGDPEPKKLYACSIASVNDQVIWHRQAFLRYSKSSSDLTNDWMDGFSLDFLSEAIVGTQIQRRKDTFYVMQMMASSSSRISSFAATASKEYDMHLLPWASVAACLSEDISDSDTLTHGRAFCFLPLPIKTGLSVQVNGYFEVSSNRRGIWYGGDMDRSGKLRSVWNRLLLEDVVAPTFVQLLLCVQRLLGSTDLYYSLWPVGSFEDPWSILVEHIYRKLADVPVLYTNVGGGKWVNPVDAFLHDFEFIRSDELRDVLLKLGMPVVHVSNQIYDMLLKNIYSIQQLKVVSPDSVRNYLRESKTLANLDKDSKLILLEYCIEDLLDADVVINLHRLPLLPLANGDFTTFSNLSEPKSLFICNELEYMLLQPVSERVIDRNIPIKIWTRLSSIAISLSTDVTVFSGLHLSHLFPAFVPAEWKYQSKVFWDPTCGCSHPTSTWFKMFWQYLRSQSVDLSMFSDWPILPSTSGHLHRASRHSKLIDGEKLSDKIKDILAKIECKIIDPSYGVDHPDLSLYVNNASGPAVSECISHVININHSILQTCFSELTTEERDELRNFLLDPIWYIGDDMNESHISICKGLPVYKVYCGGSAENINYSDLQNPPKYLPPLDVSGDFMDDQFIFCSSTREEEVLIKYFGIKRMGKAYFYENRVLGRLGDLQPEVRDNIMLSVLQDLPQLCIENPSFKELLAKLDFVPTIGGLLKCPGALYDPRNEELYALLEDSDCFPSGAFEKSGILDVLQHLGLRSSVSPKAIIQSARHVEKLMHVNPQEAYSRGKVLLSYLEVNAMKWLPNFNNNDQGMVEKMFSRATKFRARALSSDLEKFWNELRMISWCPVLLSAPFPTLPWPAASSLVAPPIVVRLGKDLWLVSGSMRILDGECSSTALSVNLGWSVPPGGSVLAAQLLELGKNNEIVHDQALRQELALAMPRIYSILTGLVGTEEMDVVKVVLEGSRWIWVGDGFATSDEVVLDGPLHLAPYIRVIPTDLAVFRDLFIDLGIREFLKPTDYAGILCKMAMRKGSSSLDAQETRAAIFIVQHLAEVQFLEHVNIYLPDMSGRLFPAGDLVYNDAPWLLGSEDRGPFGARSTMALSAESKIQKFVHGNISNEVAEKLGVCSLRRILLAESADSMNLSLSGAAEAFGQHEALTTRLKHILEMYADGPGILFELVQNAEDAGASEVIFLLDKTQYGTSSVLSPEMADWQGPALYCFNDSVFSAKDLYAISRIGQESKLEKPFAIGRFGLGFNCVYHFTDIPIFVSGENVVMFDPHACNLPGVSPSHPGLRIRFMGRRLLEQFPDQFSPLLHFGCDLEQPFPGTLFRFPLRNANVASRSQIKKEVYAPEDVTSLFSSFYKVVSEALLFLHNVKTISIFVKESGQEMKLLHRVCRNCIGEPDLGSNESHHIFDFRNRNQQSGIDKVQFMKKVSKSVGRELPYKYQKCVITEKCSAGVLSHYWITAECLGVWEAKNSLSSSRNSYSSIPWACVAAHLRSLNMEGECADSPSEDVTWSDNLVVSIHDKNKVAFEGRAFCFLPLPISTGFPAHVNAYFELSSNRRDIWFGKDMAGGGKKRSEWNIFLLEDVAAPAYGRLLEKIAAEVGPCDLYFSLWPTKIGVEPWSSMVRKLYNFVAEFGLHVLYTKARGGQWISTKNAIFPDYSYDKALELVEALSYAGLPIVTASKLLVERFMEVQPSLHFLTPQLLRTLLIRRKREFKDRNSMILALNYCLVDYATSQSDCLYGLPLMPLADGSFTTFDRKESGQRIYIACGDGYSLLKDSVPHQLADSGIPEEIYQKLSDLARNGNTNISFLSCHLLENLFLKILPVEWHHAKQVAWSPCEQGQPSLEWMTMLWSYLKSCCSDLSLFSSWPILPVGDNFLMQLAKNSSIIRYDGWSEKMSSLLLRVGCQFLRHDFPIDHPQLDFFVQCPTAAGILNAFLRNAGKLENVKGLFHNVPEAEMHELRNFILQSKWFSERKMDKTHIEIIRHLPMFESSKSRKLVCLCEPTKWLKPNDVRQELLNDDFIHAESEKEADILRSYLKIIEPSKVEFYKEYVFNCIPEIFSQDGALSALLHDVKLLIEEDEDFKSVLSVTPFVLAANGMLQQPSRLYDPRIPELRKLLHKEIFFPADKFSDHETLELLVSLGLKRTLGFTGLLDCAASVSMLQDSGDSEALSYGGKLLAILDVLADKISAEEKGTVELRNDENEYSISVLQNKTLDGNDIGGRNIQYADSAKIDDNCSKDSLDMNLYFGNLSSDKSEEEFWSEMKSISWCPLCANSPFEGLPWFKSNNLVASPSIVRPKSQMWLVSSSMHILEGECSSHYLQCKLGWKDHPSIGVLSSQLIQLSNFYSNLKLHSEEKPNFVAELGNGVLSIYSKLQEYVGSNEFMQLKAAFDGVSWIWIGDEFVPSNALAFDSPVNFSPYLYVVTSELSEFKDLLLELGVRPGFDIWDYIHVLQRLQNDTNGLPLSIDQLSFVRCVLEAIADCSPDKPLFEASSNPVLVPDSYGRLLSAGELVYNDAPWMENNPQMKKHFVHPNITNELADRLGISSLRSLSLVDERMIKDLPCMDYAKINELSEIYGSNEFLFFDMLELADCCQASKIHLIFDKRDHPRQSLLQHNLAEFQGPALVAIIEGASLNREEVSSLQLLPPWRLRGDTLNYGLGLLSCYSVCDLLSIISNGYFYLFDPRGSVLGAPSSHLPAAKMFSLLGTNLVDRFHDQFNPMLIDQDMPWYSSNFTAIRMPLSSECLKDGSEVAVNTMKQRIDRLLKNGSRLLLSLKSLIQVSLYSWDEKSLEPCLYHSISIDPTIAVMRNPFSEKKWRKFQLSRIFSNSNLASKLNVIDVNVFHEGSTVVDKWLVVLSLGSGQTRNMALDRRYLGYNLTPVAGVAALVSHDGHPVNANPRSCMMSPLPLSGSISIPVTILGCFIVRHNRGRYLLKYQDNDVLNDSCFDVGNQLIEAWNKELMSCVRDSYIEMLVECQRLSKKDLSSLSVPSAFLAIAITLKAYGDQIYSFWPRSAQTQFNQSPDCSDSALSEVPKADWECLVEKVIRPLYAHLVELPVWQLYSGSLVKAQEGMFLSLPGHTVGNHLLPVTVCSFVKEHYPVFSIPWELVCEIQAVGIAVREIKPKMVRDLLKVSSRHIVLRSVDDYIDVLEYCLSDVQFLITCNSSEELAGASFSSHIPSTGADSSSSSRSTSNLQNNNSVLAQHTSNSGDAIEMVTTLGKALFDFGRGVVEDIGRSGGPLIQRDNIAGNNDSISISDDANLKLLNADIRGLPFPTTTNHLVKVGQAELWFGNREQQELMVPLASKFIHPKVFDRSILSNIFKHDALNRSLKVQEFSLHLLAKHMGSLFHRYWVDHVTSSHMAPWISWESTSATGGEGGPSMVWIKLFWRNVGCSSDDLMLFSDWPLIPAFLGRPILCRVRERHLVFIPPLFTGEIRDMTEPTNHDLDTEVRQSYISAFNLVENRYPWLIQLLNQCNVPVYDTAFLDCPATCYCLPAPNQSLGQVIASKLLEAKKAGYLLDYSFLSTFDRESIFNLFAQDHINGYRYKTEEIDILRSLPIFKTVLGSFTDLCSGDHCIISLNSFFKPCNEHCLSYSVESPECSFLRALGVPQLFDQQILVRFALTGYEGKSQAEREDVLIYLYMNWQELHVNSSVVEALKETKFVRNADEFSTDLSKPRDLFDTSDVLLASIFSGERKKFPGERFSSEGWLSILRKLGLRTSAETDVMLECARRLEFLGHECTETTGEFANLEMDSTQLKNEVPMEVWTLAESFMGTIFSNFAVLYSNDFCSILGNIACVPAELGFPNVNGIKSAKRVLTSYSEAILSKDWPLAWSCTPILTKQSVVPPEYSWGALHLRSPPPFPMVLKHLKVIGKNCGEDTLARWPKASNIMSIDEAAFEKLKYLHKIWGSLSPTDVAELKTVAFMPAANGTRLVKASSLFVHLSVSLSPFAFELPTIYLPYINILKDLGLQETFSAASAKDLLLNLQKSCGYQRLNPNELRAVIDILCVLCDGIVKANTSDMSMCRSEIIVPDDGCRLVHANLCVYIDSYASSYMKLIDTFKLRFVHPDIPENICITLGIGKLSDVVVEELDQRQHLETLKNINSVHLSAVREKLLSRSFQGAVWRILSTTVGQVPIASNPDEEAVQSQLELLAAKMQFVKCIHTRFLLLPSSLDITRVNKNYTLLELEDGSQFRRPYFMNKKKTSVLVADPPTYISVLDIVAIVVSQFLGSPSPLPIVSLFSCPKGCELAVADFLRLYTYKVETGQTRIMIGNEVLPQDAVQIQCHPMRPFYRGEIVAFRSQSGEKLKYGRVPEDVRPSAGQALYRFNVEIAPGMHAPLLSSQIFSFRSTSIGQETSSTTLTDAITLPNNGGNVEVPESSDRAETRLSQQKELQYGQISAGELVQAVSEMLSAAGLSMDLEKQKLLKRTITLQEQLVSSQAALTLEQEKVDEVVKEADAAKSAWLCRICLSCEVDITIVPCGHVLCRRCSSAVPKCPFCRVPVARTMKIFRP